jgi:4-amino-4-deoxy-L-arabinose transferase-like glycosyltransferase
VDLLERDLRHPLTAGPEPPTIPAAADRTTPAAAARRWLWLALILVSSLRGLYLVSGALDLSPDEAHYWEWSRRLDLAYYSKGPLIAYLIRALTLLFGTSAVAIRLGAVLLSVVGSLLLYRLGREAFGDARAALLAVIGLQMTPLFWAGSLLMTIDAPFLVFWALALLVLHRALVGGRAAAWLVAGLAVGLGCLAKYTMLFVLPGLVVYLWRTPGARRWLRHPAPYGAAAIALALIAPVIVWNVRRGWVTARHVASQGLGSGLTWVEPVEFVGGQLLVLTPVIAGLLGWGLWYGVRAGLLAGREPYRFLASFAMPIVVFYALLSLQGKVQANWPAAAYLPLALVTAGALLETASVVVRRRLLVVAGGVALLVIGLGHAAERLGLPPRLDPTTRLKGWRELGAAVTALRGRMPAPERTFLVSDRYQIASELAFYVEGHPPAYNVNLGRRLNQYDFWEGPDARRGWDAIYVREGAGELDDRIAAAFERTDGPLVIEVRREGRPVRVFALYQGYSFRGMPPPDGPVTY